MLSKWPSCLVNTITIKIIRTKSAVILAPADLLPLQKVETCHRVDLTGKMAVDNHLTNP